MSTTAREPLCTRSSSPVSPPVANRSTFCGLQCSWLRRNRFYKFFITSEALYGGWTGGQYYNKASVRFEYAPLYLLGLPALITESFAEYVQGRQNRLRSWYDVLIKAPRDFLALDDRNLELSWHDIQLITMSKQNSHWMGWRNRGVLTVYMSRCRSLRFLVDNTRQLSDIADDLLAAGYRVETLFPYASDSPLHTVVK